MFMNGNVTYETCPVCQEEDCKVEHGYDGKNGAMHYWHCRGCGWDEESFGDVKHTITIVCDPCDYCGKQPKLTTEETPNG